MIIKERLSRLEQLFTTMCREHPNICPHDYVWLYDMRIGMDEEGQDIWVEHYECALCGKKEVFQNNNER